MPEGPCLRRWCELAQQFTGKQITKTTGTSNVFDRASWKGASLSKAQVYGKQMFVQLQKPVRTQSYQSPENDEDDNSMWLRYHFLMWGSLHANQYKGPSKRSKTKQVPDPRMVLHFQQDQFLAFYGGSLKRVDAPCEDTGIDILSSTFDKAKATCALLMDVPVCYSLMDQNQFAGVGNIIKNEVLYRTNTHPLELGTTLTKKHAKKIADQVVSFTKSWMEWEKEPNGKKFGDQMMIYWKFKCPLGHPTKRGWFGDGLKRMTVWCPECQPLVKESDIYKKEIVNTKKVKYSSKKDEENESLVQKTAACRKRKTSKLEEDFQHAPKKQRRRSKPQIKTTSKIDVRLEGKTSLEGKILRKRSKRISKRPVPVYTEASDDDFQLTSVHHKVKRGSLTSIKAESTKCDPKSKRGRRPKLSKISGGEDPVQSTLRHMNVLNDNVPGVRRSARIAAHQGIIGIYQK
ncbi:endonuclease 8-like 2 [Amphiura filiformis]|uniref:endonuclease 8-like 2 n=1 Tax=Amphiura filiformis TaxID=82378 RepID=UPI003B221D99